MISALVIFIVINISLELLYFRIAEKHNITGKPNNHGSHIHGTIRGAGIIFPVTFCIPILFLHHLNYLVFLSGLLLIAIVSFIDDVRPLSNKFRIFIHCIAVSLLLYETGMFEGGGVMILLLTFILVVGIINAYNFMDGVNGITVIYSLSTLGTLFYINKYIYIIFPGEYFISIISALLVFGFFNARKTAKCFAGDVGSISMGFIVSFLIIKIAMGTQSIKWILLLSVYGIDAVVTILFRLVRRENIFKAHRSHFYQYLANEQRVAHVVIALIYSIMQMGFNLILITQDELVAVVSFSLLVMIYCLLRFKLEGLKRLFRSYSPADLESKI